MSKIAHFKQNFDLVDYCFRHFEGAIWKGRKLFVSCPFHQDSTPSMMVSDGYAYCFGCGRKVDAIDIIEKLEHLTVDEIVERYRPSEFVQKRNVQSEKPVRFSIGNDFLEAAQRILLSDQRAIQYLSNRGIQESTIVKRKIGYIRPRINGAKYPRFMIPGYDTDHQLINISFRRDDWYKDHEDYPDSQKYLLHPGSRSFFYGAEYIDTNDVFLYVGGQIDSLCLEQYGILAFGAIGEASFRQEWARHFCNKKIIIMLDNDDAGKIAANRMQKMINGSVLASWPVGTEGMDVNDLIVSERYGIQALEEAIKGCGINIENLFTKIYH